MSEIRHIGRAWTGHDIEDRCPCPQEACGLVAEDKIDPSCPEHAIEQGRTTRSTHRESSCPGAPGA